jgi:hypothetical protein
MGRRAKQVGRPEAAQQVAALVEAHARPRHSRPGRPAQ